MVCGWNPTDFDKFDTEMLRAVASSGKELEVGDIGKTLRFKADGQEGILGTSLVQKLWFYESSETGPMSRKSCLHQGCG